MGRECADVSGLHQSGAGLCKLPLWHSVQINRMLSEHREKHHSDSKLHDKERSLSLCCGHPGHACHRGGAGPIGQQLTYV